MYLYRKPMKLKLKLKPMRKLLTFVASVLVTGSMFAGGLVTNTNQSAAWVRLPARNASTSIDAAYYNPAGLMKLENGIHLSVSNQSIFQTRDIVNFYGGPGGSYGLNNYRYEGTVTALAFPSIYAVYKMEKLAFSVGFNPIGGGGGAEYKKGLPSFEMTPSDLVPSLLSMGATGYSLDAYFKGSSTFLGFQGAASYKINDFISVAAGVRYVTAKNTYEGHLTDIEVQLPTGSTRADAIMTGIASSATNAATATTGLVAAGAGTLTFAQVQGAGFISAAQRAQLEGALTSFGYPTATPVAAADAIFKGAAAKYTATATLLGDQTADAEQTGSGITPFFSVNISPSENLNIAIKYEMKTKLELENKTAKDLTIGYDATGTPITMFPTGAKTNNDMPDMLTLGIDYKVSDALKLSFGSNYYFDKDADYGKKYDHDLVSSTPTIPISNRKIINKNGLSLQAGMEYNISEKMLVSCGYVWANKGVNEKYQSDLSYGLATQTFGLGGAYNVKENIQINLGFGYTYYSPDTKNIEHVMGNKVYVAEESYYKSTKIVAVGVDFKF
jgi:long-subunit fatty acid transport protein